MNYKLNLQTFNYKKGKKKRFNEKIATVQTVETQKYESAT